MTQKALFCLRWCTFLVVFGYVAGQDGEICPRKLDMISEGRSCKKACSTSAECSATTRECLCDDICGFSCVNPTTTCFQLEYFENGQIDVPDDPVFGNEAVYSCNAGYKFSHPGEFTRLCQGDRQWSGTAPATCVIDPSCGPPPDVVNAYHDGVRDSYNVGDKIFYNCNYGYYRDGLDLSICMSDGTWLTAGTRCSAKRCRYPGSIRNGRIIVSSLTNLSRVYYECNEGYDLIGRSYQTCQIGVGWSGYKPDCRPVSCLRLLPPDDGIMISSMFIYDGWADFYCYKGYKLHGSNHRRCQADGVWSGEPASCRVINCGPPEPIYNGYRDRDFFGFDSVIYFECDEDYQLKGSSSTWCLENETWARPTPKCLKNDRIQMKSTVVSTEVLRVNTTVVSTEVLPVNTTVVSTEVLRVNIDSLFIREPEENKFITGGDHSVLVVVNISTKDSFTTILNNLQPWFLITSILNRHGNISKEVGEISLFPVASDFANVQIINPTYATVNVPLIIDLSNVSCEDFNSLCVRVEPSSMVKKKEIAQLKDSNSEKCVNVLCSGARHHLSICYLLVIASFMTIHSCMF